MFTESYCCVWFDRRKLNAPIIIDIKGKTKIGWRNGILSCHVTEIKYTVRNRGKSKNANNI